MKIFFIFLFPFISACSIFGSNDTEQIPYEVLLSDGEKEIRLYKSFIKAQVELPGKMSKKRDESFKILANYIFGENEFEAKGVVSSQVSSKKETVKNKKIEMTSPVVVNEVSDRTQMYFKMPAKYTMQSLPKPKDKRIQISEEKEKIYAVITYSGSWDEEDFQEQQTELKSWINNLGKYKIVSVAKYAGYNPPWTIPWFRKNEVLLEIAK